MKKILILFSLSVGVFSVNAQTYMGYLPDNYAGVQGVLVNPATIVDSRFRADINLFSTSSSLNNDFYGLSLFDLSKSSYDAEKDGTRTPSSNNNGIVYSDVMGPSFMFNIAPKHAIALFTRARAVVNLNSINGDLYNQLKDGLDDASDFNINVGNPNIVGHTWGEIGASYATVLLQNKQHFLKGGFTAKYLVGGVNAYTKGSGIKTAFNQTGNPMTSTVGTAGELTIGSSQDFITGDEDVKFDPNSKGYGFDFGFIYEWRPDFEAYDLNNAKAVDNNFKDQNKYKLRFGLSITDIGSINYKNSKQEIYNFNNILTQEQIEATDNIDEFLALYTAPITTFKDVKVNLPSALHLDADWNMYKKFYLNLHGNIGLTDKAGVNSSSIANTFILTPRYETKWFTFSLPINYMEYSGMQVGSGLRFGPVFVGSSSVITNWLSKDSKAADVYFGVKIPVYHHKFQDSDEDGVLDKYDDCLLVAGPVENKGCPWLDIDGDTVLDKDDACINEAGAVENKGCPWGDADKDAVLDNVDTCPSVAGPVENKGCPWPDTDGDSVLDKDDKCPTVTGPVSNVGCPIPVLDADGDTVLDDVDACPLLFGPIENQGCPKVTEATLEQLRVEARSVFFNTGKATLSDARKEETSGRLDAIKDILKNYPNAKFAINGYTDNVGNSKANLKLSEARAKVVMDALIAKGVNQANLTSKGFGDKNPVKSNATAEGRAENRRTEIVYLGNL